MKLWCCLTVTVLLVMMYGHLSSTTSLWFTHELDPKVHDQIKMLQETEHGTDVKAFINISSTSSICAFDRLIIDWFIDLGQSSSEDEQSIGDIVLSFHKDGHYEAHSIALAGVSNDDDDTVTTTHSLNTTNGLIRCELNEIHCVPAVASVIAVVESNRLAILFSEATNQPSLSSLSAIDKAFSFHPRLSGVVMGHWVTSQRLEIEMDKQVLNKILLDYQIGNLIQIFPRTVVPRSIWSGRSSIRPTQHGQYRVFFMDLKREQVLFPGAIRPVVVSICDDYVPVPTVSWSESGRKESSLFGGSTDGMVVRTGEEFSRPPSPTKRPDPPKASWHVRGTTAITGLSPITIEHGALQELAVGTWSLSCWVRIIEPPTGSFRSLMYKGDANGNSRTPSIWLHPDSNRLSIRVSTVDTPDIGADSIETLPMNDWVFVSVVFMNYTAASMDTSISDEHAGVEAERNETEDLLHGIQVQYPSTRRRRTRYAPSDSGSGYQYSISLYINGHLDISMKFSAVVTSNPHPLQLFKDVSHRAGPKLLLRHLTVWSCDLSAEEVMAKYLRGHASSEGVSGGIDAILNVFKRSGSGLVYSEAIIPPTMEKDLLLEEDGIDLPAVTGGPFMFSGVRLDEGDFRSSASIPPDPLATILLEKARISLANCDSYSRRLDLYAEAAERGSAEALYLWGMMVKYGTEAANTQCGSSNTDDGTGRSSFVGSTSSAIKSLLQGSANHGSASGGWTEADDRSTYAFLVAADMGHAAALVPLAFSLLHGTSAGPLIRNPLARVSVSLNIPLHPSFIAASSDGSSAFYRLTKLHFMMSKALLQQRRLSDRDNQVISENRKEKSFPLASSVVDDDSYLPVTNSRCEETSSSSEGGRSKVDTTCCIGDEDHFPYVDATSLAIGMLHIAALHSIPEAHKALAYRYKHGMGVSADIETAVYYLKLPTAVTNDEFHRIGGQPVVEADRINDKTAPVVSKGNHGDDDELIQHQKVRAQEGHLPSMLAMGDLYYYGARGLPRDQSMALRYFEQAADRHGDPTGMCAAAGMYLKGEGTEKNVSRAISLYESASSTGSIRALNGLGYMYHFGQSVPKNSSKAFQYFLMAASFETDADSIFNAGHCLEHGLGTEVDLSRAVEFYSIAANKLGNFDSIQALGIMYLEGRGVTRSAQSAWFYLNSATDIGPWSGWLRRGLDRYLHDQFPLALSCYLHGGELGFEVSQSNAAYILRTKMSSSKSLVSSSSSLAATGISSPSKTSACFGDNPGSRYCSTRTEASDDGRWRGRLLVRQYELSSHHGNRESMLHLGNCFFKGRCGKSGPDYPSAVYYYSKAAQLGDPMSSAYLSIMHHFGIGVPVNPQRAQRYYDLAVQSKADHQDLLILQALKYALSLNSYSMLMPVNYIADYVVRVLWSII